MNGCIKSDASAHAQALWLHESCGGVYESRPKNSKRENLGETKDQGHDFLRRPRIVPGILAEGTFSMFVLVPGDNLVDSCTAICPSEVSHYQCWDDLASCFHGTQSILGMLSQNLEVGFLEQCLPLRRPAILWEVLKTEQDVLDSGTWSIGMLHIPPSIDRTVVLLQNPKMLLRPEGHFWSPEAALDPSIGNQEIPLDPEVVFRTLRSFWDPEVDWEPRRSFGNTEVPSDPEVVVGPGRYKEPGGLPFPGEATTGTCWDFAFYHSEAGHYRVLVLHAAFSRKPLSDLGVVLTSILRLIRPIPALSLIPIVIVAPCTNSEFEYNTLRFRKSLESFYLSFLPGVKDRSRSQSRSFVVGVGVGTSSCGCMETRVLPGNKSIWLTGVVPSQYSYSGQDAASLFLISSLAWTVLEPGGESFFQMVDRGLDEYFQVSLSDVGFDGDGLDDASVSFDIRQLDTRWTTLDVDWMRANVEIALGCPFANSFRMSSSPYRAASLFQNC
ncbi:hypothetical protein DY000_02020548 [Brassica cretica]|uniref:Uncharacterized protein n=1 Tax=Brassica cretica TaxID=69181 RepID=A0ABQ7EIZ7_BRACR|nr:hypothetical protein DY000_02020548 [Brassica cretica]